MMSQQTLGPDESMSCAADESTLKNIIKCSRTLFSQNLCRTHAQCFSQQVFLSVIVSSDVVHIHLIRNGLTLRSCPVFLFHVVTVNFHI